MVAHAALALDARHHFRRIGHLWHPLRTDEAGDLDFGEAGTLQATYQLDFVGRADRVFFVLQSVARTDINQSDM